MRVAAVHLRVGTMSGVATEALEFAFDVATGETAIAGAQLAIEQSEGRELELIGLEVVDAAADC